jgi:hypothetical protein
MEPGISEADVAKTALDDRGGKMRWDGKSMDDPRVMKRRKPPGKAAEPLHERVLIAAGQALENALPGSELPRVEDRRFGPAEVVDARDAGMVDTTERDPVIPEIGDRSFVHLRHGDCTHGDIFMTQAIMDPHEIAT